MTTLSGLQQLQFFAKALSGYVLVSEQYLHYVSVPKDIIYTRFN